MSPGLEAVGRIALIVVGLPVLGAVWRRVRGGEALYRKNLRKLQSQGITGERAEGIARHWADKRKKV